MVQFLSAGNCFEPPYIKRPGVFLLPFFPLSGVRESRNITWGYYREIYTRQNQNITRLLAVCFSLEILAGIMRRDCLA